ncbi:MAG TPA: fumarate hydratase, partial [Abditibacteriaceae bacterium]|nr:fumarate hydratase [Abditibacteriaceae bacterium]
MKTIHFDHISEAIAELCQRANFELTQDMRGALRAGAARETKALAKNTLLRILQNADVAQQNRLPMCQDTGLVVVFAEVGQDVHIAGGTLREAINAGVACGYQ